MKTGKLNNVKPFDHKNTSHSSPAPPKRKNWTISRANKNLLDLKAQLLDLEILQNKDLHLFRDKNRLHIIQLNISSIYM